MLNFSHRSLIIISGMIWFAIGAWLMPLGLNFLVLAAKDGQYSPWLDAITPLVGSLEIASIVLVTLALMAGYIKGTKVLGKSADRGIARIHTLPNPAPITQIYTPVYYLLIAFMVLLGMSMKWMAVPLDIRGFVDAAVGAALINGSMVYFRKASNAPASSPIKK